MKTIRCLTGREITTSEVLLEKAYKIGKKINTSLSYGYKISPDGKRIFIQNPNSPSGILAWEQGGIQTMFVEDLPPAKETFDMFDMYEARN